MLRFPLGWEFAKALCLGFFLGEVCPTLGAQPSFCAGLNATLWQPVTFTGGAKFKTHGYSLMKMPFGDIVPLRSLISSYAFFMHSTRSMSDRAQ